MITTIIIIIIIIAQDARCKCRSTSIAQSMAAAYLVCACGFAAGLRLDGSCCLIPHRIQISSARGARVCSGC